MFFLLGSDKKGGNRGKKQNSEGLEEAREMFLSGKFPVVTTSEIEGRRIVKVLGLVCCRGFDSDETFFGMASRAMSKGAQAIIGYNENVAFHPDGSKYFSCYGTAVMFDYDPADPDCMPFMLQRARSGQRGIDAVM
ncbi:MAG: YbjQ family protein [Desulfovibrio sp.]|nr:YbjQ family protein [Desulfovibrio sp.]